MSRRSASTFPGFLAAALLGAAAAGPATAQQSRAIVPERVTPSAAARAAIAAEWLNEDERRDLRVFHGLWDERDLDTPARRARAALYSWQLEAPALADPTVDATIRAEAALRRGELHSAIETLAGLRSNRADRIRAEAYAGLGRHAEALRAADGPVTRLTRDTVDNAAELTDGARALIVRARIQGQPARDYQTMVALLARAHQELDRLYWPAKLAEARLLADKDNAKEAVEALHETLALNPRCSAAWYELGRMALERFDFDSTQLAAGRLRRINKRHPLAAQLEAELRLVRDDPDGAMELLEPLLQRHPKMRGALALVAAAEALRYDDEAMEAALAAFDRLSPGSARAHFTVGRHLSLNRQYGLAAEILEEAIRREPNWPAPQIELGLMELQSGRDARALAVLEKVARLDPFNKRASNSLFLLRELARYDHIETEHFVIRYVPGIDEVFVALMEEPLEAMHEIVASRFRHEPDRKTVIEVMPDHEHFGVRITGMPWIHTIAASTGPVIALEVPREGPPSKHQGPFDWVRVVRHEYTHTVNLSQTRNRIPHWLTEAAAVTMELAPRDYETCRILAAAYRDGDLFDLDDIKWAFVRPKRPGDRALAYAQSHWMVEFMNQRYGESALVRLLELYFDGVREQEAMSEALGVPREAFYAAFVEWAGDEIQDWGLAAEPPIEALKDELRWHDEKLAGLMAASQQARLDAIAKAIADRIGRPAGQRRGERQRFSAENWPDLIRPPVEVDDATIEAWLEDYPDHPDALAMRLRRESRSGTPGEDLVEMLQRYSALRPVDPWPHRKLAEIRLAGDEPALAIPHLEQLDAREQKSPVFAIKLAQLYRRNREYGPALDKIMRAVRINPYDAPNRELAAAIAIEARDLDVARTHIVALTMLEPQEPRHKNRLEAIDRMIGQ